MVHSVGGQGPLRDPRRASGQKPLTGKQIEEMAHHCLSSKGGSIYIDTGYLSTALNQFMVWNPSPGHYDQSKLDPFLDAIFKQIGSGSISLAFSLIGDISKLPDKPGSGITPPPGDTNIALFAQPYLVQDASGKGSETFMQYFISKAHADGLKVDISFGGAAASTAGAWSLGADPKGMADQLAKFMASWNLDSVDFDIESGEANQIMSANSPANVQAFFSQLHGDLKRKGMQSILTVDHGGGIAGALKPLFASGVFVSCFDSLRLMLYGQGPGSDFINADEIKEYLDAGVPASAISIGVFDEVNYGKASPSDPAANGAAAAAEILAVEKQLGVQFGSPFIWVEHPSDLSNPSSQASLFEQAFYKAMMGKS